MKVIIILKNGNKIILDCEKTSIVEIQNIAKKETIIEIQYTK